MNKFTWAFFGTSNFSVMILDRMKASGLMPNLIVTTEDKPKGRKLVITPPEVKTWAIKEGVTFIQPKSLKDPVIIDEIKKYSLDFDLFLVASYGKIIPAHVLDIPKRKTINVHPSLLPKLRGASPIQTSIITEDETGVTIMRLDPGMDTGPIISQRKVEVSDWPPYEADLEKILAEESGKLLLEILPNWMDGTQQEIPQNNEEATFTKKINKEDAELDLSLSSDHNLRKIRAFHIWPGAFFFDNGKRVIVKRARVENNLLILERVVPEGKKEMDYQSYLNGKKS
ncbi:methionyl-tRNA formyltransferase [Patescibacteria group bacterium]|nr:methionyl-tRNA formyltransferase [Patescibacteria group bacterium]